MDVEHPVHGSITMFEGAEGVVLDTQGRYWPDPTNLDLWVNPKGQRFGAVAQGDVLVFLLRCFFGGGGEPYATNVLHFILTKISGNKAFAAAATGLAKYIFSEIGTDGGKLAGVYNPNISFKAPIVKTLATSTDEWQGTQDAAGKAGAALGTVPLRSAVVVHKGTAKAGRSFAGRVFLPAVDENAQRAGTLSADALNKISAFGTSLHSFADPDDAGTTFALGVNSPKQTKDTGANVVTPVSSTAARVIQGSQRNRQHITT